MEDRCINSDLAWHKGSYIVDGEMDLLLGAIDTSNETAFVAQETPKAKRNTMDRTKWNVLKRMVIAKCTTQDIAVAIDVSDRTARRYRAVAEQGGDPTFEGRGHVQKGNVAIQEEIRSLIIANNCLTLKNIQESLPPPLKRSPSTICRAIRTMGFTRKRVKPVVIARNEERVIESRYIYSCMIWPIHDDKLIFVDESGFNLHLAPHYGYAPRGLDSHISIPTQPGTNLSLLMAVSIDGIVGWEFHKGAYNAVLFTQWCRLNLFPKIRGREMIVIMDNASIHHSQGVVAAFAEEEICLKFLPPYSPHLNPIENVFGVVKNRYRFLRTLPRTHQGQKSCISRMLNHMQNEHLAAYFSEMRLWCERARQRQLFH
jgi:transposase